MDSPPRNFVHGACTYSYEELEAGLEALAAGGGVARKMCPEHGRLVLYNYKSIVNTDWSPFMLLARGIVLDPEMKRVAALPFPKFFNHNENPPKKFPEILSVEEKADGSLAIIYWDRIAERWRVNTRGSFNSGQGQTGEQKMLQSVNIEQLPKHLTLLAEIVGPETRVVVSYPTTELKLITAFDITTGVEQSRITLETIAMNCNFPIIRRFEDIKTVDDILRVLPQLKGLEQEGFVVQFVDGSRRKFKGDNYLAIHAIINDITPRRVWTIMSTCQSVESARKTLTEFANFLPEEHYQNVLQMGEKILLQFSTLQGALEQDVASIFAHNMTHRELGLCIKKPKGCDFVFQTPPAARPLLFQILNDRPVEDGIWKQIKPNIDRNLLH